MYYLRWLGLMFMAALVLFYKNGSGWKAHGLEPWDADPKPPVGWRC